MGRKGRGGDEEMGRKGWGVMKRWGEGWGCDEEMGRRGGCDEEMGGKGVGV